jgi:hypothetical protein
MSMKNSNDNIGNRTRDLKVCSAVPQPLRHRVPHLKKIMTREKFGILAGPHTVLIIRTERTAVLESKAKPRSVASRVLCKVLGKLTTIRNKKGRAILLNISL